MIDKFGKVMVYVNDPRAVADFWIQMIGFSEVGTRDLNGKLLSIELAPNAVSDCHLVLFNRSIVEKMSMGISLGTPSILFGTYDLEDLRNNLIAKGVTVGGIMNMGSRTFNFSDIEGNYFAVEELKSAD